MSRLIVITYLTLHEALRRRVLLAGLLGGAAFLILYSIGFHFIARDVAKKLELSSGYRVVINCGPDAGESVPHLHVHLLGKRALAWPPG